jgi:hypothetical protein
MRATYQCYSSVRCVFRYCGIYTGPWWCVVVYLNVCSTRPCDWIDCKCMYCDGALYSAACCVWNVSWGIFCQFDCVLYMSMQCDDFQVHQQQQQQHHLVGCCQFSSSRSSSSSSTRLSSTNVSAIYVIKNNSLRGNTVTGCFCASAQNQITTIETYLIEHEAQHCV